MDFTCFAVRQQVERGRDNVTKCKALHPVTGHCKIIWDTHFVNDHLTQIGIMGMFSKGMFIQPQRSSWPLIGA